MNGEAGWQGIESAPRDGTKLLLRKDGEIFVGWYDDKHDEKYAWWFVDSTELEEKVEQPFGYSETFVKVNAWGKGHGPEEWKWMDDRRASPASVPGGYALVPVEPTQEMVDAGCKALGALYGQHGASEAYKAMLSSAPTPPVSGDKDKIIASLQARIDELMLEYCPDEMTQEQMGEWAKHQEPVSEARKDIPPVQSIPKEHLALNVRHQDCHKAADAFWKYWNEYGETHKHGYYESTWGAINQALRTVGVVEHEYRKADAAMEGK